MSPAVGSDQWLCECDDEDHGHLGCTRDTDPDQNRCGPCRDGIHDQED